MFNFEVENVPVEVISTPLLVDVCVSYVYCKACHPSATFPSATYVVEHDEDAPCHKKKIIVGE